MKIITVSREFGSGGRELGKRLADLLGCNYYDREMISAVARKSRMDEDYVAGLLELGTGRNYPVTVGRTFFTAPGAAANQTRALVAERQIIEEIGARGENCVIVGRNADVILEDRRPFRLFVYADMAAKIKRCRGREDGEERLTNREMERKIRQVGAARAKRRELLTSRKWGAKEHYHLCVNTTEIDIREAAAAVAEYARHWLERNAT